ncbi:response regulator [Propionivibrio sp.]|uniref:response regulator n=1 Tax=Propionivibrio sp. TaxID=2212460 RepID=UPI0025EB4E34|nr:response regulator [Propionivibrio sp.]MBL0208274.1 response regulator [Propionivibrio sp.]
MNNVTTKASELPDTPRQRTLLLVDDEENILTSLRRLLRREGYTILIGHSGEQGLEILAQHPVDVIVSDQRMPNMTGVEFLRRVKTAYPDTVRMVLSGYTELQSITDAINEGAIYKFLTKPWEDEQLRANIAEAFRYKELADDNENLHEQVKIANQELAAANEQLRILLAERERQLAIDGVTLDIAQEILQQVHLPVIGFDDSGMIVFANIVADRVIGQGQPLVGSLAADRLPAPLQPLLPAVGDVTLNWSDGGRDWQVSCRSMGEDSPSHGRLMLFVYIEGSGDEQC